jgi:hypothetical protein
VGFLSLVSGTDGIERVRDRNATGRELDNNFSCLEEMKPENDKQGYGKALPAVRRLRERRPANGYRRESDSLWMEEILTFEDPEQFFRVDGLEQISAHTVFKCFVGILAGGGGNHNRKRAILDFVEQIESRSAMQHNIQKKKIRRLLLQSGKQFPVGMKNACRLVIGQNRRHQFPEKQRRAGFVVGYENVHGLSDQSTMLGRMKVW